MGGMGDRVRASAWEKYLSKRHPAGKARESFDHEVRAITAAAQLIASVEELRTSMNVSKSDVARRLGKQLSAISRSLTSDDSNPTVVTLLEMLDAMGVTIDITVGPRKSAREPLLDVHISSPRKLAKV
jgi:DNA-binding phage protein